MRQTLTGPITVAEMKPPLTTHKFSAFLSLTSLSVRLVEVAAKYSGEAKPICLAGTATSVREGGAPPSYSLGVNCVGKLPLHPIRDQHDLSTASGCPNNSQLPHHNQLQTSPHPKSFAFSIFLPCASRQSGSLVLLSLAVAIISLSEG
jgi:hypothetical protein